MLIHDPSLLRGRVLLNPEMAKVIHSIKAVYHLKIFA